MKTGLSVIDLFSGCGGSALGFQLAGFDIKVAVDIDEKATESFKRNFPKTKVLASDISYVSGKGLFREAGLKDGNQLVIIACPPCQGFSNARRNSQRLSDTRNNIIFEFIRIVEEIRPFAFVMENVPGLANGIGKPIFLSVLQRLKTLGYYTIHGVADASDYGVPQRRKRLVLMGTNEKNLRLVFPKPTNQDSKSGDRYLPAWNTVRNTIQDLQQISAGQKSDRDSMHLAPSLSETNLNRLKHTPHDGGSRDSWPEDLVLECHKKVSGYNDIYGRMKWDSPSPTITAGCVMLSKGRFGHPSQDRAISLREAARLQTFPDNYEFIGNVGEIASQIGNAVPPLLAKKIADSLQQSILDALVYQNVFLDKNNQKPLGLSNQRIYQ